jgi:hypothetical protein
MSRLSTEAVWKLFASDDVIAPVRPTGVNDGTVHRRPGPNAEQTEMSLQILAYNLKRTIKILGAGPLMAAMKA